MRSRHLTPERSNSNCQHDSPCLVQLLFFVSGPPSPESVTMAIISTYTIIRSISLFHITLAIVFLRNPRMIAEHNMVYLFQEAMALVLSSHLRLSCTSTLNGYTAYAPRFPQTLCNHSFHLYPPRLFRPQRSHHLFSLRGITRSVLEYPNTVSSAVPVRRHWL